jgi:hypothetical protein
METAVVKIQSLVRGHNVRKHCKDWKKDLDGDGWKFYFRGCLYKNFTFGIVDDYFQGISKSPVRNSVREIVPKPYNSVHIQSLHSQVYPALKKPLLSIFQHESTPIDLKPIHPNVSSPLRSVKQSVSKPVHFSISPQKSPRQSSKSVVTLFKYSLSPSTKPVVPLQLITSKPGRRAKFLKQIIEVTSKFQQEDPKSSRPITYHSVKKPEKPEMRKSVTARSKFVSLDKYMIMTPDASSRVTHKKSVNDPESGVVSAQHQSEYNRALVKLTSPYQSVWPQKLLLQYYNMKLCPTGNPGTKRFKLVKVHGKRKKNKASAELFDQYLKFY